MQQTQTNQIQIRIKTVHHHLFFEMKELIFMDYFYDWDKQL